MMCVQRRAAAALSFSSDPDSGQERARTVPSTREYRERRFAQALADADRACDDVDERAAERWQRYIARGPSSPPLKPRRVLQKGRLRERTASSAAARQQRPADAPGMPPGARPDMLPEAISVLQAAITI